MELHIWIDEKHKRLAQATPVRSP